jgi:hypothetical protein
MPKTKTYIRSNLAKIAQLHFVVAIAYAIQLIAYDAGKLITPDIVLRRWLLIAGFAALIAWVWMVSRSSSAETATERKMAWVLIVTDILFASYNVYLQRGMASRAVILYVLALLAANTLRSKSAVYTAAVLSMAGYFASVVLYFVLNFNEGYKLELYGEVSFYAFLFVIIAAMISRTSYPKH